MVLPFIDDLNAFMFPVRDLPRFCADRVMDRANMAPGSTGIIEGFEEEVEGPEDLFSSEESDE